MVPILGRQAILRFHIKSLRLKRDEIQSELDLVESEYQGVKSVDYIVQNKITLDQIFDIDAPGVEFFGCVDNVEHHMRKENIEQKYFSFNGWVWDRGPMEKTPAMMEHLTEGVNR